MTTAQKQSCTGHVSLFLCNAIWGAAVPVSKFIMAGGIVSSTVLADIRVLSGTLLFWAASAAFRSSREEKVERGDYLKLFLAAFFSTVLVQVFYMKGISLTSPVDAAVCTSTLPIWTAVMSALHLHEKVGLRKVGGILIGLSGTLLLVLYGSSFVFSGSAPSLAGAALCLLSQVSYGVYLVFFQDIIKKYSPLVLMKWKYLFGAVMLLPFSFREMSAAAWTAIPPMQWAAIAFVIVFSTFISYFLVPFGQKYLQPTVVAMYNYLQPVTAASIALILGQETFSAAKSAAVLLVFSGVWLVSTRGRVRTRSLS